MNNDDLKKIGEVVDQKINQALKPIKKTLDKHSEKLEKLDVIWDQTEKLSVDLSEVQETQAMHTHILKRIEAKLDKDDGNIIRLDKRVTVIEDRHSIIPPAEYAVIK